MSLRLLIADENCKAKAFRRLLPQLEQCLNEGFDCIAANECT